MISAEPKTFRSAPPRAIHPETGAFPTGDPVSDVAVSGDTSPHPRCIEMAQAFAECASNGPGADFQDLLARDFTPAEITEFAPAARELAKSMIVRQAETKSALAADGLNKAIDAARKGEFSRPPHMVLTGPLKAVPSEATDDLWRAYCFSLSACRIDNWPRQQERVLDRLYRYLVSIDAAQTARQPIWTAVEAELKACRS